MEIVIQDTGIGIADTDLAHIFDKFYEAGQIEEHFTAKVAFKGKGTGLGLTIARGIIELHGGRIWGESPGYDPQNCPGTTFHILLPLNMPAHRADLRRLSPCRCRRFPVYTRRLWNLREDCIACLSAGERQ